MIAHSQVGLVSKKTSQSPVEFHCCAILSMNTRNPCNSQKCAILENLNHIKCLFMQKIKINVIILCDSVKNPLHKDMVHSIFLCYAARSHLHVPFSFYSHSFKLGTLHCSLFNDICQNDFKYVTIFISIA